MFGLSDLYTKLILGAALFVVAFGAGAYLTHKLDDGKYQRLVAADAAANAAAIGVALKEQSDVDAKRLSAAVSEANAQVRIVTRTLTTTKEIPVYVTPKQDATVCVPFGFVRLLYSAERGVDPASLNLPAGDTDDTCTGLKLSDLAAAVTTDYGAAQQNAEQLDALIAYINAVSSAEQPPAGLSGH